MPGSAPGPDRTGRVPGTTTAPCGDLERRRRRGDRRGLHEVVHRRAAGEDGPGASTARVSHDGSLVNAAVAAHEHVVLDDHRQRARRLEHAADLRAGAQVHPRPTCAHEPTSACESIMVPSPTYAPTLTYIGGMQTTPGATYAAVADRRPARDDPNAVVERDPAGGYVSLS